jgi:hypothetical protein
MYACPHACPESLSLERLPGCNNPQQQLSKDLSANTEKPLTMGVTAITEELQVRMAEAHMAPPVDGLLS